MPSQYGDLRSTSGWDRFGSFWHPQQFQRVSRLGFITAAMSLNGGQPNFARCLAVSWVGKIFSGTVVPPDRILYPVQNSLYVQVLRSPILAALLRGTSAAGVSQTLWHRSRNGITELLQRTPSIFGSAAITLGIGPPSSLFIFYLNSGKWRSHTGKIITIFDCGIASTVNTSMKDAGVRAQPTNLMITNLQISAINNYIYLCIAYKCRYMQLYCRYL